MDNKLLNEDWIESTLGEVCFTTSGGTPSRQNKDFYNGNIPWIKSGELDKGIIYDSEEHISEEAIKKSSAKIFPKGTLLFALYGATIGKMATLGVDAATNQAICGIYKSDVFNSEYLYNFLSSQKNFLIQQGIGGAQPNISQTILKKLNISIAPLVEQKAIVNKIEELFSSLDSGIVDLKTGQDQLFIYRQAVLKKAFEGEWKTTTVGELFEFIGGGTPSKKEKDFWNGNIPWASVKDIKGDYLLKTQDFITEKGLNNSSANFALKNEIILITRISPGKSLITTIDTAINQDLKVVKPKVEIYNKYVHYLFKSIERICIKLSSGTTVKGINLPNLKSIEIPIIKLEEQHRIVQEIESRLSVCDKVEESIKESLQKAIALRQSILKKAFEGKLLSAAEIAECKEHKDYEPASVLLKKIRAEKSGTVTITTKEESKKIKTIKKRTVAKPKISTDVQAGVIAKVIQLHENNPNHLAHLTHVKCEKISHLVECHLQIPLGRIPVKDAAGPDDYNHLKKVEHRASMAGYFKVIKKEIGHTYASSRNITKAIDNLESKVTAEQKKQLDNLINLFLKFDLERAEIIATLYAGWNNLLIDGKTPTDDEIVYESRENWSKRKLTIERERFYKALQWMRKDEISLVPIGFGTKVLKPNKQK